MTKEERAHQNKMAFDEIIGDPYAKPESLIGQYEIYKNRGIIGTANNDFDSTAGTINPARPSILDFFCDVESCVQDGLNSLNTDKDGIIFINTYFAENSKFSTFNQKERAEVEQTIGRILVARKVSPVAKYFIAIRNKTNKKY